MRYIVIMIFMVSTSYAQQIDQDLQHIMLRLDSISRYEVMVELRTEISFINMPTKTAEVIFHKDRPLEIRSEDFVLLPKRGMDLSMQSLFTYPFITVERGEQVLAGTSAKMLNLIPTDDKAEFTIATLYLDTVNHRLVGAEISTRNEGTYKVIMGYDRPGAVLPTEAEVIFSVEKLRIPLNFMGKDTSIDRKAMREDGSKEGRIFLNLSNYRIERE